MRWFRWPKRDDAVDGTTKVSMYTLSTCPSCNKAKKFFADRHIAFQFTNYDLADQATQDKWARNVAFGMVWGRTARGRLPCEES